MNIITKLAGATALGAAVSIASAAEADHAAEKRKFSLPPSADLLYAIDAQQSGMQLHGSASIKWCAKEGKFVIESETRASIFGKIIVAKSEGSIDQYGLAPAIFTEKRIRKDATTTAFDRVSALIRFSDSAETYPIKGGEQDRISAVWQLVAVARGAHGKFKTDSAWRLFVAGQRDAQTWTFKVDKSENIHTPMSDFNAMHVIEASADGGGKHLDIWLAPSLEWYPVRIRVTEANGDYVEQALDKVVKAED